MLDQEMSGGQDIYSPVPLCVCKVMCMCVSLHVFQQQRPNCSISAGVFWFFLLNFMPLKKNPKGFCLGDCPAFPSQKLGTKNNGKIFHYSIIQQCQVDADPVQLCSYFPTNSTFQKHQLLPRSLFLQLHLGTLDSTYIAKQGALPGSFPTFRLEGLQQNQESTAQVLRGQDFKPLRSRVKLVSCEQPTPSFYSHQLCLKAVASFLPDTFTALLVFRTRNRGASISSQTAFTMQHKLR